MLFFPVWFVREEFGVFGGRVSGMVRRMWEFPDRVGVEGFVRGDVVFDEFGEDTMTLGTKEESSDGKRDFLPGNIERDESCPGRL
jgi:hypothetical protein